MVPPLSDPLAACSSCHVGNPYQIAQEYGDILGITVGNSEQVPVEPHFSATAISETPPAALTSGDQTGGPSAPAGMVIGSEEVIDYQQRYEQAVTGARPINVGNVIAATLIFAILLAAEPS